MEEFPDFDSIFDPDSNYGSAIAGVPSTGGIETYFDEDWFEVSLIAGTNMKSKFGERLQMTARCWTQSS